VAKTIREQIREEHLTASAGVAPNKFLAKIASDWRKPDGLFVIQPHEVQNFLLPLPVGRIPGLVTSRRSDYDCARVARKSRARTKAALPFSRRRAQQLPT
jgi:nucleotidyltransferase/DNA polymerase involved in DNA repair